MADPVTAATIAKLIAKAAAKKVGEEIGKAIAKSILGGASAEDIEEIKQRLREMDAKLDDILLIARETYQLVEQLPDVIRGEIRLQTLDANHAFMVSQLTTFETLETRPDEIPYETLRRMIEAWQVITDGEPRTEYLIRLPRYAEHMFATIDSRVSETVSTGLDTAIGNLEGAMKRLEDGKLEPAFVNASNLFATRYVRTGKLLEAPPMISWVMHPTRTRTVTRSICLPQTGINGTFCQTFDEQVPDTAFNNGRQTTNTKLANISKNATKHYHVYSSLSIAYQVLTQYREVVASYQESLATAQAVRKINVIVPAE